MTIHISSFLLCCPDDHSNLIIRISYTQVYKSINMLIQPKKMKDRKATSIVLDEFSMASLMHLDAEGLIAYFVIEESNRKALHLHTVPWGGNFLDVPSNAPSGNCSFKHTHTSICYQSQKDKKMTRWGVPHGKTTSDTRESP